MCSFRGGVGNHQLTLGSFSSGFNRVELLCYPLQQRAALLQIHACESFVSAADSQIIKRVQTTRNLVNPWPCFLFIVGCHWLPAAPSEVLLMFKYGLRSGRKVCNYTEAERLQGGQIWSRGRTGEPRPNGSWTPGKPATRSCLKQRCCGPGQSSSSV